MSNLEEWKIKCVKNNFGVLVSDKAKNLLPIIAQHTAHETGITVNADGTFSNVTADGLYTLLRFFLHDLAEEIDGGAVTFDRLETETWNQSFMSETRNSKLLKWEKKDE